MGCPSCGAENPCTNKFCGECGAALVLVCDGCGTSNPPTNRYCGACGARLGTGSQGTAPSAEPAAPERYTPKHLAEKILASRAGLEGERKQVTVLFADVVGSTELIQGRDTEEAQVLLDGVVKVMMDAVHRYEGTVSRLMGDGLMAMFGAPIGHEDHAVRACYAALAMLDGVRRHAEAARRAHGTTPTIRVGLSAGEVVVRSIRDDLHMDYTAMGQTVHLGSRMEQLAAPGTAALTAETVALVEGYVQVRPLGKLPIKGLPDPVEAFELLGMEQARTRLQVAAARGLTRFVGRDAEMAALYATLERAGGGRGQVVALVGDPGVGKSRLVWELTHSHRVREWLVLESGSVSYGKATSYLPVIDLLKEYCRIEARDDARAIREKVTGKLLALDRALEPTLPPLLALLDALPADEAWEALDPAQRRRRTLDAVRRLLLRESREQPLLLIFEDLHWIDAETQALLDGLVEGLPAAQILLLVNYRTEYTHGWANRGNYAQLRIDPLGEGSTDELLAGLLGGDPALDALKALLRSRTEGNPLFLEESVRALAESGALVGERGAYRLNGPLAGVRVPATVQAVLAARIDRLPVEEKRLLQIAAVIGKDVPDALLRAVADRGDDELHRTLAALQPAEFLYEASLFPELEYTFKHALTHEVAYGSLLQERRRTLHARVMAAIERVYAARLEEQTERLAHHAVRAESWERAVAHCRRAGTRAVERSAYREATTWFEEALRAVARLPSSRGTHELAVDLRLDLSRSLQPLGRFHPMLDYLREAESLAKSLGDQTRLATVCSNLASRHQQLGDGQPAVEYGERALDLANAIGRLPLQCSASLDLGVVHYTNGAYRRAVSYFSWVVDHFEGDPLTERFGTAYLGAVSAHGWLAFSLATLGDLREAAVHRDAAIRLGEAAGHPLSLAGAYNTAGLVCIEQGAFEHAARLLERGIDVAEANELTFRARLMRGHLGLVYAQVGRITDGVTLLEQSIEQFAAMGHPAYQSLRAGWLGHAYRLGGRCDDARRLGYQAVELGVRYGERGHQARAIRVVADAFACSPSPDLAEGETHYREALEIAEELEMGPLQAHCHLGLGKLYRRTSRVDEARAALQTAVAMLREMGMAFWLPEAERELAEADG